MDRTSCFSLTGILQQLPGIAGSVVNIADQLVTGKNPILPPYEILPIRQINPKLSQKLLCVIERASKPGMWEMLDESVVKKQKPAPDKAIPKSGFVAADVKLSTTVMLRASEQQEIVASGHSRKVKRELLLGPSEAEKALSEKARSTLVREHTPLRIWRRSSTGFCLWIGIVAPHTGADHPVFRINQNNTT